MEARARRAAAAVGLAVVLVAAVGAFYLRPWKLLAAPMARPPVAAPARPAVVVQQAQFVSASVGWVVTGSAPSASLFRTTDAGRHWQRQVRGLDSTGLALSFFDGRRGVISVVDRGGQQLLRTTDGGQHWTRRTSSSCKAPPQLFFFLDLDHGWCIEPSRGGKPAAGQFLPDSQEIALYRTTDGGLDWSRVLATDAAQPASGGLSDEGQKSWIWFRDASTGWIGQHSLAGHAVVYATTDAGDHWRREELPPPTRGWGSALGTLEFYPPPRGGGSDPVVVVSPFTSGPQPDQAVLTGLYFYEWRASAWVGPVQAPDSGVLAADQSRLLVTNGASVLESADGGETWTTLGAPPSGWLFFQIKMVDHDHGWATLYQLPASGASGSILTVTGLARTADAGHHWTVVNAPS